MAIASKTRHWSTADTLRLLASDQAEGDDFIDLVAIERTLAAANASGNRFLEAAMRCQEPAPARRRRADEQPADYRLFRDDEPDLYVPRHLKRE